LELIKELYYDAQPNKSQVTAVFSEVHLFHWRIIILLDLRFC